MPYFKGHVLGGSTAISTLTFHRHLINERRVDMSVLRRYDIYSWPCLRLGSNRFLSWGFNLDLEQSPNVIQEGRLHPLCLGEV
jgi:hypothetical protein